jgi:hypothetical protein
VASAIEVSDSLSNANEQIERAAKAIGTGKVRPKVFDAIYFHKAKIKTVSDVVRRTRFDRIRVLQEARHLVRKGIVRAATKKGETAYEMIEFFHVHKSQILDLARNPTKLGNL